MIPLAIPTAFSLEPNQTFMILTISAILAGSVYGDNTTLISDSSILSALSSRCDVRHHCSSQMPYATLNAIIATFAYLACGMALSSFPNYAGLLVFGAFTVFLAYILSVPVIGDRQDPLGKILNPWWAANKNGAVNGIAGFTSHLSNKESIRYRSSSRFNLAIMNKDVADELQIALTKSGSLSRIYSQNIVLNALAEEERRNSLTRNPSVNTRANGTAVV